MPYLISWNPCKERGRMFHLSEDELKRWKISTGRYDAPPSSMNHLLGTRTGLTAWPSSAVGRKSDLICIHQRPEYSQYFRDIIMKQVITGIVVFQAALLPQQLAGKKKAVRTVDGGSIDWSDFYAAPRGRLTNCDRIGPFWSTFGRLPFR